MSADLSMTNRARGWVAFGGTVIIATAMLAGCAAGSSPTSSSGGKSAGTLVLDNVFNDTGLDPGYQAAVTSNMVFRATYDTLLSFNGSNVTTPVPDAALSYTESSDAKVFTFKLRTMKFSDGTPLTAQDVVFSFNRLKYINGVEAFLLDGITVTAPNPQTVVLTSATPNPAIPRIVTTPELSILNAKLVEAHGGTDAPDAAKADKAQSWLNYHSAGSGPYVVSAVEQNTQVTLTANPDYWGPKPAFGTVIVRNVPAATQYLDIQRDSDEIAYDITGTEAQTLKSNSRLQVVLRPSTNIFYMGMQLNAKVSPDTANKDIWNAVKYGLDYQRLTALGGGGAAQMPGIVPQGLLGALPHSDIVQQDLAKAKAYVKASGIAHPTFALNYIPDFSIFGVSLQQVAQIVQASLAQVGINVTLQGLPFSQDLALTNAGKAQATVELSAIDYPDPNDFLLDTPGGEAGTRYGYTQQAYPATYALAQQAGSTVSDSQRATLFQQLQQQMNTYSPWIPEFQPESILVGTSNLTGVESNDIWGVNLATVGVK
jgi:peptide/nickel transport system substrate-binding protein